MEIDEFCLSPDRANLDMTRQARLWESTFQISSQFELVCTSYNLCKIWWKPTTVRIDQFESIWEAYFDSISSASITKPLFDSTEFVSIRKPLFDSINQWPLHIHHHSLLRIHRLKSFVRIHQASIVRIHQLTLLRIHRGTTARILRTQLLRIHQEVLVRIDPHHGYSYRSIANNVRVHLATSTSYRSNGATSNRYEQG